MRRHLLVIAATIALMVVGAAARAEDDATSLSYISYLERYATVRPAESAEALDAVINMPVLAGDRLETSRGARVEVQLADGSTLWLDEFSTLDFDAIAFSRDVAATHTALYLAEGAAMVEIPDLARGDGTMRFDSPGGTVYLHRPGLYRVDVRGGPVRVEALSGLVELPAGVGSALLRTGQQAWLGDQGSVETAALDSSTDDFAGWVDERRHPRPEGPTTRYVDARDAGRAAILDSYGEWVYVDGLSSWMWHPRVAAGWVPYSNGRWYWTPVGWSWISYEPWGWYPFHYGSWYLDAQFGWVWGWDWVWGPAWVNWIYTPGYVGWCPRGYYDFWYFNHRHHHRGRYPGDGGVTAPPRRWARNSLDFSGRVRFRDVDPRPWTIVPAGQFTSTNVDRVRLGPSRLERDLPADREAFVRSGPLLTRAPTRTAAEQILENGFQADRRPVPGLATLLRRDETSQTAEVRAMMLRSSTTDEMMRQPVRSPDSLIAPRGGVGGAPDTGRSPGRTRTGVEPSDRGSGTTTRGVRRGNEGITRSPRPSGPAPSAREATPRTVERRPTTSQPSSPPHTRSVEPRQSPQRVPDRPPSSWSPENLQRSGQTFIGTPSTDVRSRTEVRRWEVIRSTGRTLLQPVGRVVAPRSETVTRGTSFNRSVRVNVRSSSGVTPPRSAPSRSTSHTVSPRTAPSRSSSRSSGGARRAPAAHSRTTGRPHG